MKKLLLLAVIPILSAFATDAPAPAGDRKDAAEAHAGTKAVSDIMKTYAGVGMLNNGAPWLSPEESRKSFRARSGLKVDLIAAEPEVVQPLYVSFDSRGRLWVTQYIQFQYPAGVKVMSYDQYLRAVYDQVPQPPPSGVKGADKVTIFEPDGQGGYRKVRDVISGLNIATAAVTGAGGIWVLNPPYLLFYPDRNDDDIPDGDPVVCLQGFGIQDTHAVANSLQWGPDGWLYGANGSTTEGLVSSAVSKQVRVEGQHIWRYNPKTTVFEVYAEGGGNTFSCEIDAQGRVFSGTNDWERGMHFDQGMSGTKNFGKHGLPDNPYAFGYFDHLETKGDRRRFSQAFCVYDGDLMARELGGHILAGNALQNLVYASKRVPDTSTFQAVDEEPLLTSSDKWFRPVDVKVGPDGAVWVADWYDSRLSYVRPVDDWSKGDGRIYRIRPEGAVMAAPPFDLHTMEPGKLMNLLQSSNKWSRRQAVLELFWREETAMVPRLADLAVQPDNPHAFDALCALQLLGGLTDARAIALLHHPDPYVRRWVVRCIGDAAKASREVAKALTELAANERHPEVRTQLLASAKRLPAATALPIAAVMMAQADDLKDKRIPLLLWWALESKVALHRDEVVALFTDRQIWESALARQYGAHHLSERLAMAGGKENFEACARLLSLAPNQDGRSAVVKGMADAFEGGIVPQLPAVLSSALADYLKTELDADLALAVRIGSDGAAEKALAIAKDIHAPSLKRGQMILALADAQDQRVVPVMVSVLSAPGGYRLKATILPAAGKFSDPILPRTVLTRYVGIFAADPALKAAANHMLAGRHEWARMFLEQIVQRTAGRVGVLKAETKNIEPDVLRQMEMYQDPELNALIKEQWPSASPKLSSSARSAEIARLKGVVGRHGEVAKGREIFTQRCAACHTLFGEGAQIGPELTGYQRDNLDFWLTAIVDPSLEIREGFSLYSAKLKNGQTLAGMLIKHDATGIALKNFVGQVETAKPDQVQSLEASRVSLMPEGLLDGMGDSDLQNLFAYLTKP